MAKKKEKDEQIPEEQAAATQAADAPEIETVEADGAPETPDYAAMLAAEKDRYLRLAAEYDNYRKRSQKEREGLYAEVRADTITKLLPVFDNLDRALLLKSTDEAFYKGVEMTMNQLLDIFSKLGVTIIPALGEPFDPLRHNAVMHVEDESVGEGIIVEEFQKGFMLGDKVIRFSMVKVAN